MLELCYVVNPFRIFRRLLPIGIIYYSFIFFILLSYPCLVLFRSQSTVVRINSPSLSIDQSNDTISDYQRKIFDDVIFDFPNISYCPEKADTDSTNSKNATVRHGGWWQPIGCKSRHTVAVIIPYRDRLDHLNRLLPRLHNLLQNQLISYRIFVIEQNDTELFNKGSLYNIAYLYVRDHFGSYISECMIFHDVDLIPESDGISYTCPDTVVRHMSPAVDKFEYLLPYDELVGGVLAMNAMIFLRVNGYSNLYRGWGGEDDDMWERLQAEKISIIRPPMAIGRYKMLNHPGRPLAQNRYPLLRLTKRRYKTDGVNQLFMGQNYNISMVGEKEYYTHIYVSISSSNKCFMNIWCFMSIAIVFYLYKGVPDFTR